MRTRDGIAEHQRGTPAAVEGLAEPGQDRRQHGGEEAALVARPRVGSGAAGVHDGGAVFMGMRAAARRGV